MSSACTWGAWLVILTNECGVYLEDDLGYLALLHLAAVLLLAPLGDELIDILDCDVDISAASIIMISDNADNTRGAQRVCSERNMCV